MYFKSIFHFIKLYEMSWKSGHIPSRYFRTEIVNHYTKSNSDLLLRQESQCCHLWSHRSRAQIPIWFPQVQFHRRHFGIVLFPWTLEQSKKSLKWFNQIYNILMVKFGQDFLKSKVNSVCLLHLIFFKVIPELDHGTMNAYVCLLQTWKRSGTGMNVRFETINSPLWCVMYWLSGLDCQGCRHSFLVLGPVLVIFVNLAQT